MALTSPQHWIIQEVKTLGHLCITSHPSLVRTIPRGTSSVVFWPTYE